MTKCITWCHHIISLAHSLKKIKKNKSSLNSTYTKNKARLLNIAVDIEYGPQFDSLMNYLLGFNYKYVKQRLILLTSLP